MATVQLKDGSLGWRYPSPRRLWPYKPTATDLVGVRIDKYAKGNYYGVPLVIIRENGREGVGGASFLVARVEPDGTIGRLVGTVHLEGRQLEAIRERIAHERQG